MIKLLRIAVLLLGMALLFASCQKAPELTITSSPTVELNVDGSSGTITFTANRDWTVSSSDSWVTISPSSGEASDKPVSVTVRCNANTTYDDRTATVTIRMEDLSQSVTIKQPANKGVVLPKQVFDLQSDAKSIDIEVQANVQYTVSTSVDWIKQTGTKGLTSKTLTFSIEENKTYDAREGKITIKPQDSSVQEQVISVKQAQKDALNVEKTSYDMPYGGGEIEIKVEANVSFDVTPNSDWIHYVSTKALNTSTVLLKIDENATYAAREGKVDIRQQNGSLKHTITINQSGRIAVTSVELSKTSLSLLVGDSETLTVTVKPDNATNKSVIWTSSNESVAKVSDGTVTALKTGTCTIKVKAQEGSCEASCTLSVWPVVEYVDLGLSVKWATCNIGATAPQEYGEYFAWGETSTRSNYGWWKYYKYCSEYVEGAYLTLSKYNLQEEYGIIDGLIVLDSDDDVATKRLGSNWRIPTKNEWEELANPDNCSFTWMQLERVPGIMVTSKKKGYEGNAIFLPAAGCKSSLGYLNAGYYGYYWTSSLDVDDSRFAWECGAFSPDYSSPALYTMVRTGGQSIRPVSK